VEFLTHIQKPFFSFFATMPHRLLFVFAFFNAACMLPVRAQTIPATQEEFFASVTPAALLPEKIVSGRSLLLYDALSATELAQIQQSLATTGIDAVLALPLQYVLGGHDVRSVVFNAVQKREIGNLVFFLKSQQGYRCVVTAFSFSQKFIENGQPAWQHQRPSLGELLLQLQREALNSYKKQNLLVNEVPETELPLRLIEGSRLESFTTDLRADRVAVRLARSAVDAKLKEVLNNYPFTIEFVADSIPDQQLRQRGFWYVLNCVYAPEAQAREWLGFAPVKANPLAPGSGASALPVYKFYVKKLEFNNWYMGKWDADPNWQTALANFIANLRKEVGVR
jgi:hypothetical protein